MKGVSNFLCLLVIVILFGKLKACGDVHDKEYSDSSSEESWHEHEFKFLKSDKLHHDSHQHDHKCEHDENHEAGHIHQHVHIEYYQESNHKDVSNCKELANSSEEEHEHNVFYYTYEKNLSQRQKKFLHREIKRDACYMLRFGHWPSWCEEDHKEKIEIFIKENFEFDGTCLKSFEFEVRKKCANVFYFRLDTNKAINAEICHYGKYGFWIKVPTNEQAGHARERMINKYLYNNSERRTIYDVDLLCPNYYEMNCLECNELQVEMCHYAATGNWHMNRMPSIIDQRRFFYYKQMQIGKSEIWKKCLYYFKINNIDILWPDVHIPNCNTTPATPNSSSEPATHIFSTIHIHEKKPTHKLPTHPTHPTHSIHLPCALHPAHPIHVAHHCNTNTQTTAECTTPSTTECTIPTTTECTTPYTTECTIPTTTECTTPYITSTTTPKSTTCTTPTTTTDSTTCTTPTTTTESTTCTTPTTSTESTTCTTPTTTTISTTCTTPSTTTESTTCTPTTTTESTTCTTPTTTAIIMHCTLPSTTTASTTCTTPTTTTESTTCTTPTTTTESTTCTTPTTTTESTTCTTPTTTESTTCTTPSTTTESTTCGCSTTTESTTCGCSTTTESTTCGCSTTATDSTPFTSTTPKYITTTRVKTTKKR